MWRIICLITVAGLVLAGPAAAGKNHAGALVVHCYDQPIFTGFEPCVDFEDPGTCENARTQSNRPDSETDVIWLLAAFHEYADPGVSVIYFGLEHNLPVGNILSHGFCGPAGSLEVPDAGWPDDPEIAGNSLAFGTPITGNRLFPFYWFATYGFDGAYLGTGINPTGGYAGFVSDDEPGILDEIERFGVARWYEPGSNDCPVVGGYGACCFDTGECREMGDLDCWDAGGDFFGDETDCDPNPCPQEVGACCFIDGHCEMFAEFDCGRFQGSWQGTGWDCDPNPCNQPLQACCFSSGDCSFATEDECEAAGGTPQGFGTNCEMISCKPPAVGACCLSDAACVVLIETDCSTIGGVWYEAPCDPSPCVVATERLSWGRMKALYR